MDRLNVTAFVLVMCGATVAERDCTQARAAEVSATPPEFTIVRAPANVKIDGRVDEWPMDRTAIVIDPTRAPKDKAIHHANNDPGNPIKGAGDVSARAVLAWDDTNLYIAAVAVDDDLRGIHPDRAHNVGPPGWGCDSVMFQIHSFRKPLKSNSPYSDSPFLALRYQVQPGGRGHLLDNKGALGRAERYWKLPRGSRVASRETATGYAVEAAVPWASLGFTPQPGEALFCSFLLGDIDRGEALNQLGWNYKPPRERPVFRLVDRPKALGLLTLATGEATAGSRWSLRYRVDAMVDGVAIKRVTLAGPDGQTVKRAVPVPVPKGQTARDVLAIGALPTKPGRYTLRLEATVAGKPVVLARETLTITPPAPPTPLVTNPPGEIHRMRPDRVAHNAYEDYYPRGIVRHGFVTDRKGYERYILTHIKASIDTGFPWALKRKDRNIARSALECYVLYRITGDKKYAQWTRQGLAVAIENLKNKPESRFLAGLMPVRYFVWQNDPDTKLAPPGIEAEVAKLWVHVGQHPDKWMFLEWGYHNRCWHRWAYAKLALHFAKKAGQKLDPKFQEYVDWHDQRVVKIGDTTDNSAGYHWVFFHYPVLYHMTTGTMDQLVKNPGYVAALTRYRQLASPSGAVPHFGDTSGWLTGAGAALANYELMGRLTKDGRFRWQAHRIAEYLYNHFWPRHNQYHGPRDNMAMGFCTAWLWADDAVKPREPSRNSRVTFRPRVVALKPEEEGTKPGYRRSKLTAAQVPDKLILTSGNKPNGLWALVEVLDRGGHCGQLPGHFAAMLQNDSAVLAGQGYYEKSQDFNNVVWVEDLEGIAADPRPVRTEIPRFVEDRQVTYARVRVLRYGGLPITSERDIVFVKDGFVLVKDRLTFHATMKVRVGPCWQTRDLGPQCGRDWFNGYYDQLYHTGLGLGRGIHAVRNPAWDLMVAFGPREGCRTSVLDRYDDNPYRVSPVQLRQYWSGIVRRGQSRVFTTVLVPHAPALDVDPYRKRIAFIKDDDATTVVRVQVVEDARRKWYRTHWVQLHDGPGTVQAKGWTCDARLAVTGRDRRGRVIQALVVDGKTLSVDGQDRMPKARQGTIKALYSVKGGGK